jgi:MORN repeat protein
MVRQLFILAVLLAALSPRTPRAIAGCQDDTQCKGDRVCEKGVCSSPASKETPATAPTPGGNWIADQRSQCRVWDPSPQPQESILWSGACKNGLAHGPGTLEWFTDGESAEVAQGEWRDGKQTGHGVSTKANGERFEGDYHDGKANGYGVSTYANGDRFEGEVRDGKAHGHGIYTWANGERYSGEWRDGQRNGHGVNTEANGNRYDGAWRDDKANGHGIYTKANGERYDGEWRDGCGPQNVFIGRGPSSCPK